VKPQRKIIHIDMDAFFAAVEQRDFPQYRGKPLIVGGSPDKRGVVATCSYEARKFGVHSAMSSARAYKLCPQAIVVSPRFEAYKQASEIIRSIFYQYTELVEPLSLDEAYLDLTHCSACDGSATLIAQEIKEKIYKATGLTASAGVSYNKFLAKVASDMNKPDGITVIRPEQGERFVEALAVGKFYGIGKATEARMHALGIKTGADIKRLKMDELQSAFGNSANYYFNICRAIDQREVIACRERKSLGCETTYENDLNNINDMKQSLTQLIEKLCRELKEKELAGYTITLKVKYGNFEQITRSKTEARLLFLESDIQQVVHTLLKRTDAGHRKVRLLGITVSNFADLQAENEMQQLSLF